MEEGRRCPGAEVMRFPSRLGHVTTKAATRRNACEWDKKRRNLKSSQRMSDYYRIRVHCHSKRSEVTQHHCETHSEVLANAKPAVVVG